MGLGRTRSGAQGRSLCGFGLFCVGYDVSRASRPTNAYVTYSFVWPIEKEGEGLGIDRWSDFEERKRNVTDAKAGDELPADNKGDAASRVQASEGPKENEEKREVVEKLKGRES
jgi:hypothetical protein